MKQSNNIITLIMPTINRPSIHAAINSVKEQDADNWILCVAGDGFMPNIIDDDDRIFCIECPRLQSAGEVRNYVIQNYVGTDWVGFIDDDDYLYPSYVSRWTLLKNQQNPDVILFKMNNYGVVVPTEPGGEWVTDSVIRYGNIGMSFCAKFEILYDNLFDNEMLTGSGEDHRMIKTLYNAGYKIWLDTETLYHVRKKH